ncbi:hypothetical protein BH10PSE17_BH10PSE17_13660 [soil metagenome]
MTIVIWVFRILVLLVFFGFALLNTEPVALDLLLGVWHAPLVLILLIFFAAGAVFGVAVSMPVVLGTRRELRRMQARPPLATARPANAEPPRL